jgi:hypothetical protein
MQWAVDMSQCFSDAQAPRRSTRILTVKKPIIPVDPDEVLVTCQLFVKKVTDLLQYLGLPPRRAWRHQHYQCRCQQASAW